MSDMSSPTPTPPAALPPVTSTVTDMRMMTIIIYGLYLAATFLTAGVAGIIGVILAYVKRDDAKGTVWESHIENAIQAFWIFLIGAVVGWMCVFILIGFIILPLVYLYFLYRVIKGLILAIDSKPYA